MSRAPAPAVLHETVGRVGSICMLASDSGFRISSRRCDLDVPVRLEVGHMILHLVQGSPRGQAAPIHLLFERAEYEVLRFRDIDDRSEQRVEFGLVRNERVAPKTQTTRFTEQDQ